MMPRHILKHGEWVEFEQGDTIQEYKLGAPCEYFHILFAVCRNVADIGLMSVGGNKHAMHPGLNRPMRGFYSGLKCRELLITHA